MKKLGYHRLTTLETTRNGLTGKIISVDFTIFEDTVWIDDDEGEFDSKLYEKARAREIYRQKLENGFEVDR